MQFDDKAAIKDQKSWPRGGVLCLKKYAKNGEKKTLGPYSSFGVIVQNTEPVKVFLRGGHPAHDFEEIKEYNTIDDLLGDGWVVD